MGEFEGLGTLKVTMNGEYNTKVQGQFDGATVTSILGAMSVGGLVAPRWEHRMSFGFERGPWGATLSNRLRVGYLDLPSATLPDRRVDNDIVWNLRLAYRGWRTSLGETTLAVGIDNLFDREPPFTRLFGPSFVGFDRSNGDPRGRFFHTTLGLRLN